MKPRGPVWTREQVAELRRLWPAGDAGTVARALGRSPGAVISKASRLGLVKTGKRRGVKTPGEVREEAAQLCEALGMARAARDIRLIRLTRRSNAA